MTGRAKRNRLTTIAAALCLVASAGSADAQSTGAPTATLRGRVLSAPSGQPIANATVSLPTVARTTRTDSLGEFLLQSLPIGEFELVVAAVGYSPARATVPLAAGPPLTLDIELSQVASLLDSVVTEAEVDAPRNIAMNEFESRRVVGLGRFLTRANLLRERGRSLDGILRSRVPGVRIVTIGNQQVAASGRAGGRITSSGECLVNVIVDGVLHFSGRQPYFDLRLLEASMIAGIEYYTPATLPAEFNMAGNTPCGTLVIWMQN